MDLATNLIAMQERLRAIAALGLIAAVAIAALTVIFLFMGNRRR